MFFDLGFINNQNWKDFDDMQIKKGVPKIKWNIFTSSNVTELMKKRKPVERAMYEQWILLKLSIQKIYFGYYKHFFFIWYLILKILLKKIKMTALIFDIFVKTFKYLSYTNLPMLILKSVSLSIVIFLSSFWEKIKKQLKTYLIFFQIGILHLFVNFMKTSVRYPGCRPRSNILIC